MNSIPLNPAPEIPFQASMPAAVDASYLVFAEARVTVSVRRPGGQDTLAAWGWLHLQGGFAPASAHAH